MSKTKTSKEHENISEHIIISKRQEPLTHIKRGEDEVNQDYVQKKAAPPREGEMALLPEAISRRARPSFKRRAGAIFLSYTYNRTPPPVFISALVGLPRSATALLSLLFWPHL